MPRKPPSRIDLLFWLLFALCYLAALGMVYGPEIKRQIRGEVGCVSDGSDHSKCWGPDEERPEPLIR